MAVHSTGIAFVSGEPGDVDLYWLDLSTGQILKLQNLGAYLFLAPSISQAIDLIFYSARSPESGQALWQFNPELLSIVTHYLPIAAGE